MANITIQKIFPSTAWAKVYAKMGKTFAENYVGSLRSRDLSRKERETIALGDLKKEYVYWILLDGKKIGYILAPIVTSPEGEHLGRYLDTRYIEQDYRGKGYGTQAFDLLCQEDEIKSVKLNGFHFIQNWQYWDKIGYGYAVMACVVDKNYAPEYALLKATDVDNEMLHWYVLKNDEKELDYLRKRKAPFVKTSEFFKTLKKKAA